MPRYPTNTNQQPTDSRQGVEIPGVIRSTELTGLKKDVQRGNTAVYLQDTEIELKLKVLAEAIAKEFLSLHFSSENPDISATTVDKLDNTAYIFVDNNGKPVKVLAPSVLRTEIAWDDLAADTKQKIQLAIDSAKLVAGKHIKIEDGVISANVGVESVNGRTGDILLSANDFNSYTKNDVYNKGEVQDIVNNINIIIDGGRIGEDE